MIVVDASMALAWCFESRRTAATDALLEQVIGTGGIVPLLWRQEVANGIAMAARRGRVSGAEANQLLSWLSRLPLRVDNTANVLTLGQLAIESGLTAYDATYLDIVQRTAFPLATLDQKLAAACRLRGFEALPDN